MAEIAQKYQDKYTDIKKDIEGSFDFFKDNYKRFNFFRSYLFKEQIDPNFAAILNELQLPQHEFNVIYPYISRILGEFTQQEPSPEVSSISGQNMPDLATLKVIEDYFRHVTDDAKANNTIPEALKTMLSGGFCVLKLGTKYLHEQSMDQEPTFELAYASDMCGFDPIAVQIHKGDGRFCWEAFPKTKAELKQLAEEEGYTIDWDKITFSRKATQASGALPFQWSYVNQKEEICLIVDYYFKKRKKIKLVKMDDHPIAKTNDFQKKYGAKNGVMHKDKYEQFVNDWQSQGLLEQAPGLIGEPRNSYEESIWRYRCVEGQVLEAIEMDFSILPLVFCGHSIRIRTTESGVMQEFTIPYGWHAKGMQDLKNYAGNVQANELQNMIQHKFMIAEEALPSSEDFKEQYCDVQHASLLVFKAYADFNPDKPLPQPQIVNRQMVPPIISETFQMMDQGVQNTMGSYDAQLGIQQNQLSGVAIENGATQNNAVAMPHITCLMHALSRIYTGMLKMLPKYFVTPRTLPVKNNKGKRGYVLINSPVQMNNGQSHQIKFDFDENDLQVKVEAGVNYEIQRMANLQMLNTGMSSNPGVAQFMASDGLKVYFKNLRVSNSDELVEAVDEWQKKMQQQQAQQAQQAQQGQQNNPLVMKAKNEQAEIQRKMQKDEMEAKLDVGRLAIDHQNLMNDQMALQLRAKESNSNMEIQLDKHQAEKTRAVVDLAMKAVDMHHGHNIEEGELHHKVAKTILEHNRHEAKESNKQEIKEHK